MSTRTAGAAAATAAVALGFGFALGGTVGRLGLLAALFGIGGVPARALELEPGRGDALLERRLTAGRAVHQRRVAEFLHHLELMAATFTAVLIDRHRYLQFFRKPLRGIENIRPQVMGAVGSPDKHGL